MEIFLHSRYAAVVAGRASERCFAFMVGEYGEAKAVSLNLP